MSDGWVWLRCCGCGSNIRLLAYSGGSWGRWNDEHELASFIDTHSSQRCHGSRFTDEDQSRNGYSFFEIVTEKMAPMEKLAVNDVIRDPSRLT